MTKYVITVELADDHIADRMKAKDFIADWLSKLIASAYIDKIRANITINADEEIIMHRGYDC